MKEVKRKRRNFPSTTTEDGSLSFLYFLRIDYTVLSIGIFYLDLYYMTAHSLAQVFFTRSAQTG